MRIGPSWHTFHLERNSNFSSVWKNGSEITCGPCIVDLIEAALERHNPIRECSRGNGIWCIRNNCVWKHVRFAGTHAIPAGSGVIAQNVRRGAERDCPPSPTWQENLCPSFAGPLLRLGLRASGATSGLAAQMQQHCDPLLVTKALAARYSFFITLKLFTPVLSSLQSTPNAAIGLRRHSEQEERGDQSARSDAAPRAVLDTICLRNSRNSFEQRTNGLFLGLFDHIHGRVSSAQ